MFRQVLHFWHFEWSRILNLFVVENFEFIQMLFCNKISSLPTVNLFWGDFEHLNLNREKMLVTKHVCPATPLQQFAISFHLNSKNLFNLHWLPFLKFYCTWIFLVTEIQLIEKFSTKCLTKILHVISRPEFFLVPKLTS